MISFLWCVFGYQVDGDALFLFLLQVAKVIAPKRSQTIGILLSSLRVEMSDIEHGNVVIYYNHSKR